MSSCVSQGGYTVFAERGGTCSAVDATEDDESVPSKEIMPKVVSSSVSWCARMESTWFFVHVELTMRKDAHRSVEAYIYMNMR